ncbi:T9SS type A sorting domain-containing protein, partial [Subsaxibacter sp. CAU 1640]|uniref:T9SS type A sorting domain-containing protein n=1 Tax=Subsaxibacter sp. CAU 1640 TaxID=2933271 RepID=UPI002006C2ED|nr:T9SS type A sorting domain-containing protein [Subsaxibacter sp. CAU 1640]
VLVPGECEGSYTVTRTWTATDDCGNSSTASQVIEVEDNTAPVLVGSLPQGESNVNACYAQIPEGPSVDEIAALFEDSCSDVIIEKSEQTFGDDCGWIKLYVYQIQDSCGNMAEEVKVYYNGSDQTGPDIELPEVDTLCGTSFPKSLTANWTDNCSGSGTVTAQFTESVRDGCMDYADYVFEATDACGNKTIEVLKVIREFNTYGECETAFAKDPNDDISTCFIPQFNRWGWTNHYDSEGLYTLDLYAGADHCDVDDRTPVGNVVVDYSNGYVTLTYNIFAGYTMTEAQVYIGCGPYPFNNNTPTVAPGQYPFNLGSLDHVTNYTLGPIPASGSIDVIAHAVTCTVECECSNNPVSGGTYTPTINTPVGCGEVPSREVADNIKLDFTAYPVPFDNEVNIKYNFKFDTEVSIDVHDTKGLLILSETNQNYRRNKDHVVKLDLSRGGDQIFYVTVTTNRGAVTKKIVSSGVKRF